MFTSHGSYASPDAFVSALVPAMWVGVAVLAAGVLIAAALPFDTREAAARHAAAEGQPPEAARSGHPDLAVNPA